MHYFCSRSHPRLSRGALGGFRQGPLRFAGLVLPRWHRGPGFRDKATLRQRLLAQQGHQQGHPALAKHAHQPQPSCPARPRTTRAQRRDVQQRAGWDRLVRLAPGRSTTTMSRRRRPTTAEYRKIKGLFHRRARLPWCPPCTTGYHPRRASAQWLGRRAGRPQAARRRRRGPTAAGRSVLGVGLTLFCALGHRERLRFCLCHAALTSTTRRRPRAARAAST